MDDLKQHEFEFKLYDLYSEKVEELRQSLYSIADALQHSNLRGPLFAMTHEMAVNALKALYKRAYYKYMIIEVGLDDLPYEDWLKLFQSELEEHKAENFANLCREKGIAILISGQFVGRYFRIDVINEGTPTDIEMLRINNAIQNANNMKSFDFLFELDNEDDEVTKEGGSIGIPMIIMSLRGLGVSADHFKILTESNQTISRIELPMNKIQKHHNRKIQIMKRNQRLMELTWNIFLKTHYSVVRFDLEGNLLSVQENLLDQLNIPHEQAALFEEMLPERFYSELFTGAQSAHFNETIQNYRTRAKVYNSDEQILFNISGYVSHNQMPILNLFWHSVELGSDKNRPAEGSMFENLRVLNIVEPYLHPLVMKKAREMAKVAKFKLPEEVKEATIFFADLVGFTHMSEKMKPNKAIELLNIALEICVHSITKQQGQIDKFMGDAIMAIFDKPLAAVIAAIEIQKQYNQLNDLRQLNEQPPLNIRIGINTGTLIMGNIGTSRRMDWTAIGDVVNTASRIEKAGSKGAVTIGENTYQKIRDHVKVDRMFSIKVKGKEKMLTLYSISSITFEHEGEQVELSLEKSSNSVTI